MDSLQDFDSPVEAGFTSPIEAGAWRRSLPTGWSIDPVSDRPIEYHELDLTLGGNLGSNGIDIGGIRGAAITDIWWMFAIPGWGLR